MLLLAKAVGILIVLMGLGILCYLIWTVGQRFDA